jgi:hypothetical protein
LGGFSAETAERTERGAPVENCDLV